MMLSDKEADPSDFTVGYTWIHDISPTDISPTDTSPTDISPTDISPTDISSKSPRWTFRQPYIFFK